MHISTAQRVGELSPEEREKLKAHVNETSHIISGTLEGQGAVSLASEKAEIDGKIIKLERTASGGISYQVAIFVDEPEPEPAVAEEALVAEKSLTLEEQAVSYFTEKGMPVASAVSQVKRFGVDRVLAMRNKELDEQLSNLVSQVPAPIAKKDGESV